MPLVIFIFMWAVLTQEGHRVARPSLTPLRIRAWAPGTVQRISTVFSRNMYKRRNLRKVYYDFARTELVHCFDRVLADLLAD